MLKQLLVLSLMCAGLVLGHSFSAQAEDGVPTAPEVAAAPSFPIEPTQLQSALSQAGFYTGPVDGIVGKRTKSALRAFQRANGLKADGICGPKTWEKLGTYATGDVAAAAQSLTSGQDATISAELADGQNVPANQELKQKLVS